LQIKELFEIQPVFRLFFRAKSCQNLPLSDQRLPKAAKMWQKRRVFQKRFLKSLSTPDALVKLDWDRDRWPTRKENRAGGQGGGEGNDRGRLFGSADGCSGARFPIHWSVPTADSDVPDAA
jgi:hypothetical protein